MSQTRALLVGVLLTVAAAPEDEVAAYWINTKMICSHESINQIDCSTYKPCCDFCKRPRPNKQGV